MKLASLICVVIVCVSTCDAEKCEVEIALTFNQRVYRIGDELEGSIRFTNVSRTAIRLLPEDVLIAAADLELRSMNNGKRGTVVRLSDVFDIEELAKHVILLGPGKSFTRVVRAEVRSDLPEAYTTRH